jgi:copper(I)-binding protein
VNALRLRFGYVGRAARRTGPVLAGTILLLAGLAGATPARGAGDVTARLGPLTVSATVLRPGPAGTLTTYLQVSTSGQASDQLDAAIAADGTAVAVYHQQVNVGEITDLTGCGTELPPPGVVNQWLHYGPLLVPGRSGGPSPPAAATLTVQPGGATAAGATVAIALYFADAGAVILHLPVSHA